MTWPVYLPSACSSVTCTVAIHHIMENMTLQRIPDRRLYAPATFVIPFTSSNGPVTDPSDLRRPHPWSGNCSRQLLPALLYPEASDRNAASRRYAESGRRIALHPCSRQHPAPVGPGAQDIARPAWRWSALGACPRIEVVARESHFEVIFSII